MSLFRPSAAPVASGASAERMAETYLRRRGLKLLERNYSCRQGELDLVMLDTECLVFVEVRYRKSSLYGSAAETVTASKQRKLVLAAQDYLVRHPRLQQYPARFDVLAISPATDGTCHYNWLKHAFDSV